MEIKRSKRVHFIVEPDPCDCTQPNRETAKTTNFLVQSEAARILWSMDFGSMERTAISVYNAFDNFYASLKLAYPAFQQAAETAQETVESSNDMFIVLDSMPDIEQDEPIKKTQTHFTRTIYKNFFKKTYHPDKRTKIFRPKMR